MPFSDKAIKFFSSLTHPGHLPDNVEVLNPYHNAEVQNCIKQFFTKFFNDDNKRIFIWGINPGRFGGGLTGISFTDPVALRTSCRIDNNLGDTRELSSKFIYEMIAAFGGANEFYSRCFLTALYPLALIKNNKNYNYYDDPALYNSLKQELKFSFKSQISFGAESRLALCLGKKNFIYLNEINKELNFFERIEIVEHPRYILQYKNKTKELYIKKYIDLIKSV